MNKIKTLGLLIIAFLLVGCAATGPKYAEVQASIPTVSADKGRIYFYRDDSMIGFAIQPEIRVANEVVGKSVPGGFFFIDRPPGMYEIATSTEVENKVNLNLAARETRFVRTTISMGVMVGRVKPDLIYPEQAQSELANLSYIGAAFAPNK